MNKPKKTKAKLNSEENLAENHAYDAKSRLADLIWFDLIWFEFKLLVYSCQVQQSANSAKSDLIWFDMKLFPLAWCSKLQILYFSSSIFVPQNLKKAWQIPDWADLLDIECRISNGAQKWANSARHRLLK